MTVYKLDVELNDLKLELLKMFRFVEEMIEQSIKALLERDEELAKKVYEADTFVDQAELDIERHCMKIMLKMQPVAKDFREVSTVLKVITDIERISDYAVKMENYSKDRLQARLNEEERDTISSMHSMCMEMYDALHDIQKSETLRRQSEDVCVNLRKRQMQRMKEKSISSEISMMFSQLLTDFERINGHALNIAEDYEIISRCVQLQID